jgi:hypothetical protein
MAAGNFAINFVSTTTTGSRIKPLAVGIKKKSDRKRCSASEFSRALLVFAYGMFCCDTEA